MGEHTYEAFVFRQQRKAPLQVSFVAHAEDISSWAGVPRKSDEFLTGYQRFRDDARIDREIVPFFQEPKNCSPTAIITSLRTEAGFGACDLVLENDARLEDIGVGEVHRGTLTVRFDAIEEGDTSIFERALEYVRRRLGMNASASEGEDDEPRGDEIEGEDSDDDSDAEDSDDDDVDAEAADEDLSLGSVTLKKLEKLLADQSNWANPDFRAAIIDYVKPASIIDGQHRVAAAAKIGDRGLPFMVCGLYGASWDEQVFQFTVVNLKPKRIPPALITSIAALSLTRAEHRAVENRLSQAGVKMDEVTIMSLVAYDEASPFCVNRPGFFGDSFS